MTPNELILRLETAYDFQCPGGPLAHCVEWIALKRVVADQPYALRLACEFGVRNSEKGHNLEQTLLRFEKVIR